MQTILVVNSKGGSGKTTIATTLATYFANRGYKTVLMDYDPQGSSLYWLKIRQQTNKDIYGANAAPAKDGRLRSWQMIVPQDTEKLIIDAPAGSNGILLQEICGRAEMIIVPVAPSSIDVHATADFIKHLLLVGKVRLQNKRLAVIANRVQSNIPLYEPLNRFLNSLSIPFVAKITESYRYVDAIEQGLGLFDLNPQEVSFELSEFNLLIEWVEDLKKKGNI